MAEGSTGTAVYGSRQLSITHSRSLKGRLQCSCPVSLCFAVPYFILSMLEHCSNASIAAHTHTQTTHKCHTMTHVLCTFWQIVDTMTYSFIRNKHNAYISISKFFRIQERKKICMYAKDRTEQTKHFKQIKKSTALQ